MPDFAIYSTALGLGGGLISLGIWVGSFRSNFMTKSDCHACQGECSKRQAERIDKLESDLRHDLERVDKTYGDKTELLFSKIEQLQTLITAGFEDLRLDLVRVQTSILAHEKRLENT